MSILTKLRIAAAIAVGVLLIGFLAWPMVRPVDPYGVVSLVGGDITIAEAIAVIGLAFLTGLAGYFCSWPYGREIGILAVPSGLAIWAIRTGSMSELMRINPAAQQRQQLLAGLQFEPFYWLIVFATGFFGVLVAQKIAGKTPKPEKKQDKKKLPARLVNCPLAIIGSVLIAQLCIWLLAQGFRVVDSKVGSALAQPATGQIVFAVFISFCAAGFIFKKFLDVGYLCPIIASGLVTVFVNVVYIKEGVIEYMTGQYPPVFFPHAVISVLPVQMVAFGALGSVCGYWLAIRFDYWRKNELE